MTRVFLVDDHENALRRELRLRLPQICRTVLAVCGAKLRDA